MTVKKNPERRKLNEQITYNLIKIECQDRLAKMTNEELKICLDVIGIFRYCRDGFDKQLEQVIIEELTKPDRTMKESSKNDR